MPAKPFRPWTPGEIAKLGTMPDTELARSLGCGKTLVRAKRKELGIAVCKAARPWLPHELELLGTLPDDEVARLLGCGRTRVGYKREEMGIDPYRKHKVGRCEHLWTPEALAWLGTMSDAEVARRLGCSGRYVGLVRAERGIEPFKG